MAEENDSYELPYPDAETWRARVDRALEYLVQGNGWDGGHHKDWFIDQAVRALCGAPMETQDAVDYNGTPYSFETQGENQEYRDLVAWAKRGEDGPDTYSWETGIVP